MVLQSSRVFLVFSVTSAIVTLQWTVVTKDLEYFIQIGGESYDSKSNRVR